MSNCSASCTSVRSPLIAAIATFALKADAWFRRGLLLMLSPDSRAKSCPLSGKSSTYRPVQILEAGSDTTMTLAQSEPKKPCIELRRQKLRRPSAAVATKEAPRQLGLDFPEPQRFHFTLSRFDNGADTIKSANVRIGYSF